MPYPTHVTLDSILNQARTMIEMEGVEALSLNVLAEALGVKTPSLYRYVDGRAGLLRAGGLGCCGRSTYRPSSSWSQPHKRPTIQRRTRWIDLSA